MKLEHFNRTFNDETFVIEFDSNLQPSGYFSFINNDNDHFSGNSEQGNVNFVLGDDYECTGNCVCGLKHIEELSNSSDRNLKFKFNEKNDNSDRWLKIDAVNRKTRWYKSFLMGVGISLLFASLSSIFVLIYDDGFNHEFENLRKVKDWIYIKINRVQSFLKSILKLLKE
ncbi:MAG: hypothetical protein JXA98_06850 [Methanosarcinaceae archaeon]|nr:hypothetical protein [Methanosarcinaceae archaeon]